MAELSDKDLFYLIALGLGLWWVFYYRLPTALLPAPSNKFAHNPTFFNNVRDYVNHRLIA